MRSRHALLSMRLALLIWPLAAAGHTFGQDIARIGGREDVLIAEAYVVTDLPVWRIDGAGVRHFDPNFLIAHLRNLCGPSAHISPAGDEVVLVAANQATHEKVSLALSVFREFAGDGGGFKVMRRLADEKPWDKNMALFVCNSGSTPAIGFVGAMFQGDGDDVLQALSSYSVLPHSEKRVDSRCFRKTYELMEHRTR